MWLAIQNFMFYMIYCGLFFIYYTVGIIIVDDDEKCKLMFILAVFGCAWCWYFGLSQGKVIERESICEQLVSKKLALRKENSYHLDYHDGGQDKNFIRITVPLLSTYDQMARKDGSVSTRKLEYNEYTSSLHERYNPSKSKEPLEQP